MKQQGYAVALILLAFCSGIVLTAMTSGCDSSRRSFPVTQAPIQSK